MQDQGRIGARQSVGGDRIIPAVRGALVVETQVIDAALACDVDLAQDGVQAVFAVADAQRVGAGTGVDEDLRVGRGASIVIVFPPRPALRAMPLMPK